MTQEQKPLNNKQDTASSNLADQLRDLRQQLQAGKLAWSDTAVTKLMHALTAVDDAPSALDMEMLSLVVEAALSGEDIAQTYPLFYQQMLVDDDLKRAFEDALAVAQDESPVPELSPANLDFLTRQISPPPQVKQESPGFWEAVWQLIPPLLNRRITPALAGYRSGQAWLREENMVLAYNEFSAGEREWEATLELLAQPDAPGQVSLYLNVLAEEDPQPPLTATVQWGSYEATAVLDEFGSAHFPPFPVTQILDKAGKMVSQPLVLSCHPAR